MKSLYIFKSNPASYVEIPVPKDLSNFYKVEVEDDFYPKPLTKYDIKSNSWVPNEEKLAVISRKSRDTLLENLDTVISNPLRWAGFSEEQKEKVALYRLALLDVPQQEGFPLTINWPEKPDFI